MSDGKRQDAGQPVRSMRPLAVAAAVLLAGCLLDHGEFQATPCKPKGTATYGVLRVHVQPDAPAFGQATFPAGKCVGLYDGGHLLATGRFDATGNATVNVPSEGALFLRWVEPRPDDHACAIEGSASVTVPGPDNVTLQVGGVCY